MAVRDAAATLEMCLASLSAQTFEDWEAVVVDDGSQDATQTYLGSWARRDPRIRPFRTPPKGLVPALNLAAERSLGLFLARQDADDASHPERLAHQVAALTEHPEWDLVGSQVTIFPEPKEGLRRYQAWVNSLLTPEEIRRDIWIESPIPHPTAVVRRDVFEEAGGYRDMGWPEDYDLWLRLHLRGKTLAKVPKVLYAWRDAPDRLSRRHPMYSAEAFRRCKAHHLASVVGDRRIWIWGAGPFGRRLARALREEGIPIDRFVDIDPLKIGRRAQGAPVEDVSSLKADPEEGRLLLVCVGVHGARDLIRRQLTDWNYRDGRDYFVVS
jgi:glycosyltransferase involved in cell wall biosynthesis